MRQLALPCLFLTASLNLNAQSDPSVEPATMLEMTVGGRTMKVAEGAAFDVNGTPVSARVSDVKALVTSGLDVDYPRHFAFAYDGSVDGMRQWTLDGNNVVLMLFEIDGAAEVKDFEEGMAERFGKKNCKGSNTSRRLGGKDLQGRRLDITLAGTALSMDMLKVPSTDDKTRMLFLQDTRTDSGGASQELTDTVKLLDRTIAYK